MTVTTEPATEKIALAIADGTSMDAYVVRPRVTARTPRGILILQDAFGVHPHIREYAGRFADMGYAAIAPELYHRTAPGQYGIYPDSEKMKAHSAALTVEGIVADLHAAYRWLAVDAGVGENIASVGWCMGGRWTFIGNAHLPLRGGISYYGGAIAPKLLEFAAQQHGPLLMMWGGKDKNIPLSQQRAVADALDAAGKDHTQIVFSEAGHGFFHEERPSYNKPAAQHAWAHATAFLATIFGDADERDGL